MRKTSFDKLEPVKFTVNSETYTMPAVEFARICPCAVQGSKASIKEKIAITKLTEEQLETVKLMGILAAQYGDRKERKTIYPRTPEQVAEENRYQEFMAKYQGREAIGRRLYSGAASNEAEAVALIAQDKADYQRHAAEKREMAKKSIFNYTLNPFTVETDKGPQLVPLRAYIAMCPDNVREPTPAEVTEWENRSLESRGS